MIKIEKNVPLPTRAAHKPRAEKYPELRQLEVGDSFVAPITAVALMAHARRVAKETGRKFVVRNLQQGSRVWRKE
jgi:hypothetical protein